MKVLLIKDVQSLGKAGEVKEVKSGYGQNFLIKKGLAKNATPEVLKEWEEEQKHLKEILEKEIEEASKIKEILSSSKFIIKHKVGANGHLIGSITNKEIASVIKEQANVEIDKKAITLKAKIKSIGTFEADCKLGHGIHASITIDVIDEVK